MPFEHIKFNTWIYVGQNIYKSYLGNIPILYNEDPEYDTIDVSMGTNYFVFRESIFRLINHHTGDIYTDMFKQILQRIACHKYLDENRMFDLYLRDPEDYGLTKEYVKDLEDKGLCLFQWKVTPWLMDDYNHILDQLRERGYKVERLDDYLREPVENEYEKKRVCNNWYKFDINGKEIFVPAQHPPNYEIDWKYNRYEDIPFWSLRSVLEELYRQCPELKKSTQDDLNGITLEDKDIQKIK